MLNQRFSERSGVVALFYYLGDSRPRLRRPEVVEESKVRKGPVWEKFPLVV